MTPDRSLARRRFFRLYYGPFLTLWPVKIIIILFFILWMFYSFYSIKRLTYGSSM
jgi:hypothetical protein